MEQLMQGRENSGYHQGHLQNKSEARAHLPEFKNCEGALQKRVSYSNKNILYFLVV